MKHFVLGAVALLTGACAHVSNSVGRHWHPEDLALAARAWPYAQIAYNSYHREKDRPEVTPFILPETFQLIDTVDNDEIGLAYDIYEEALADEQRNLIFAFRGTEGGIDLFGLSNCDWKFGNHRLHQQQRAVGVVSRYLRDHPKLEPANLIFVGHSLGGGIALHNSYRFEGSWAYVFNSSPKFSRPRPYRQTETDTEWRRISIAQRGEILKIARAPSIEARQIYLPVSCARGGLIERHSMLALATCLTRVVADEASGEIREAAQSSIDKNASQFTAERLARDWPRVPELCRD